MPRLDKGITKTEKGHVRVTAGKDRGKYKHRLVFAKLLEENWHPIYGDKVPNGWAIHHIDWRKDHNCPDNLCGMDEAFHNAITAAGRERANGKWIGVKNVPDWVTREEYV